MVTCPAGHRSATTDYCDECGAPIGGAAVGPTGPIPGPRSAAGVRRCVVCATEMEPDARFCEACGHDSARPGSGPSTRRDVPPRTGADVWSVVVTADRTWFDEVCAREGPDVAAVRFPHYCPRRAFVLAGSQMTIGRHSRSRGIEPEIDLSGPPLDPGVSSLHAVLLPRADGGWDLTDVGSTNGTVVNGSADPIAPNVPVRLAPGDRIKIGAWTVLTVEVQSRA